TINALVNPAEPDATLLDRVYVKTPPYVGILYTCEKVSPRSGNSIITVPSVRPAERFHVADRSAGSLSRIAYSPGVLWFSTATLRSKKSGTPLLLMSPCSGTSTTNGKTSGSRVVGSIKIKKLEWV